MFSPNNSTGHDSWQGVSGEKIYFQTDDLGRRIITLCDLKLQVH